MTESTEARLEEAIRDYLAWIRSLKLKRTTTGITYEDALSDFVLFVRNKHIDWNDLFTPHTLKKFRKYCRLRNVSNAIRKLSLYLFRQGRILQPLPMPHCQIDLPGIYEQYLIYYEKIKQVSSTQVKMVRRVLASFHDYLERSKIHLSSLKIEHLDACLAEFHERFAQGTCTIHRCYLRGFLSYLYHERQILKRDLAPLLVGAPMFAQAKPPKFLRAHEVQRLFDSLKVSSAKELRTYAMVHLAYFLGLRPQEITLITLDDIAFSEAQLTLRNRKNTRPLKLPLPEAVLKAIVAYVVGSRPKSKHRTLFLTLCAPPGPMSPSRVGNCIRDAMRKAGLASSAYWLRHTYAQNLLEAGASLYEIKEMLGHDTIESTRKYLHIHITLMREVLFDEPI